MVIIKLEGRSPLSSGILGSAIPMTIIRIVIDPARAVEPGSIQNLRSPPPSQCLTCLLRNLFVKLELKD